MILNKKAYEENNLSHFSSLGNSWQYQIIPNNSKQYQTITSNTLHTWYDLLLPIHQVLSPVQYQYHHGVITI